jgi:hypothetical protein
MGDSAFDIDYIIATLRDTARQQHGVDLQLIMYSAADCISQQETLINYLESEVWRLNSELEQAIAERTPHDYGILAEQRDQYKEMYLGALKEIAKARAEVEEVKKRSINAVTLSWDGPALTGGGGGVGPCAKNDHHVPAATKMIRPEPSRLEIAAMLFAGWLSNPDVLSEANPYEARLLAADKLIAAAKGGAK